MAHKRFNIYTPDYIRVWLKVDPAEDLNFVEDEYTFDIGERPGWLDVEIAENGMGWDDILGVAVTGGWPNREIRWLLKEGIAPGQPFLVEMGRPHYYKTGGYCGPEEWGVDYDADVMQLTKWPTARVLKAWTKNAKWYYGPEKGA